MFEIFDLPRRVKGLPLIRAVRFGAKTGEIVGTYGGERRARIIQEKGAAGDLTSGFTQELFESEIKAIRMGAQI
jgi:hypothetical protein